MLILSLYSLLLLAPLVLLLHLLELSDSPIIFNIKQSANFFRALSLDHVSYLASCQPKESRNIQVVRSCNLK